MGEVSAGVSVKTGGNIPGKGVLLGKTLGEGEAVGVSVIAGEGEGVGVNEGSRIREGI